MHEVLFNARLKRFARVCRDNPNMAHELEEWLEINLLTDAQCRGIAADLKAYGLREKKPGFWEKV
jgi:hypothetical protein